MGNIGFKLTSFYNCLNFTVGDFLKIFKSFTKSILLLPFLWVIILFGVDFCGLKRKDFRFLRLESRSFAVSSIELSNLVEVCLPSMATLDLASGITRALMYFRFSS